MEIFAPLAGRIGVQKIREELEDLSFTEISPDAQKTISVRLQGLQENVVANVVKQATALRNETSRSRY